ncbi:MAG: cytochrome c [Thermoguttaceae bacterium]|nr:cytochrome c [Thermoguttaceae bacterium]MDW8079024.1 cytochrome c [Thermoguttaceae bacterium]
MNFPEDRGFVTSARLWGPQSPGSTCRRVVALFLTLMIGSGCQEPPGASFRLNLEGRDPAEISSLAREEITRFLEELFGTPDEPRLPPGVDLDLGRLKQAAGHPVGDVDAQGTAVIRRGYYRRYCARCHGISGDGAGPAALVMDPYPRDFRRGIFVYTSTVPGAKPSREDIRRGVRDGLPGSGMPGFSRLGSDVIEALVDYVIYLAIRGETELLLIQYVVDEEEPLPLTVPFKERFVNEDIAFIASQWRAPEVEPDRVVVKPPSAPSFDDKQERAAWVQQGKEIYLSARAQCSKCHGLEGAGDGEQAGSLYDDWNYPKRSPDANQTEKRARLYTLPLRRLRARNLKEDLFRGGNRPEDLYLRIAVGLKGTPMPGAGGSPEVPGVLNPAEIWQVVWFVRSLSGQLPRCLESAGHAK